MIICPSCKVSKDAKDYSPDKQRASGIARVCKVCKAAQRRAYYAANPEKRAEQNRKTALLRSNDPEWKAKQRAHSAIARIKPEHKEYMRDYRLQRHENDTAYRAKTIWSAALHRATKDGLLFTVTVERIEQAIIKGVCERSGIPFELHSLKGMKNSFSPSIDKINSFGDYTIENVQIVCWVYNRGKAQMTDAGFIEFCKKVAEFNS